MIKVAVVGANGQLGKTLHSIVKKQNNNYKFFTKEEVDITQKEELIRIFSLNQFDYCVNCAAYTNVEGAEKNSDIAFKVNSEGAKNIAEVCKKHNVTLIHISTDYVFDGTSTVPYKTSDETKPVNQYGKSKLQGEINITSLLEEHYIIRTSWLYSAFGKNFVKTIISKIENNSELKITTLETGTPTSCRDLSLFIIHIIEKKNIPYGIYNFSAKGSTTWYLYALEIAKNLSPNKVFNIVATENYKTIAKRPKYSVLNMDKTELIYKKTKDWQSSLSEIIEELKNNRFVNDL